VLIAGAGLVLAGFGMVETLGEVGPYGQVETAQRFSEIADGRYSPGDSVWSKDLYFADCLELPRTILVRVQPPARREAFATQCRDAARAIVAQMPTYSAAWLALAEASAQLGDVDAMRAALATSTRTAPDLAWLAERRSALAFRFMAQLDEAGRAAYRADLAVLLRSAPGLDALATRYAGDGAQRRDITALVEAAPAETQERFLARLRALVPPETGR